jgi:hypothetical protein
MRGGPTTCNLRRDGLLLISGALSHEQSIVLLERAPAASYCVWDADDVRPRKELAAAVNKSDCWFLIISREVNPMIPVHYRSLVRLVTISGKHVLECAANPKLGLERGLLTIIEDSKVGFEFYRRFLPESKLVSAGGFSRIPKFVESALEYESRVQVIADAATFGDVVLDIRDLSRVVCFLPECAEQIFPNSLMFECDVLDIPQDKLLGFTSSEDFFVKTLREYLSVTHKRYDKSAHPCLFSSCVPCRRGETAGSRQLYNLYNRPSEIWSGIDCATGRLVPKGKRSVKYFLFEAGRFRLPTESELELAGKSPVRALSDIEFRHAEKRVYTPKGICVAAKVRGRGQRVG